MHVLFAISIMSAPFAFAALLTWATHGAGSAGRSLRLEFDDRDDHRTRHDADAVRTRFEHSPSWPVSGVLGERR